MGEFKEIPEMEEFLLEYYSPDGWYVISKNKDYESGGECAFFSSEEAAKRVAEDFNRKNKSNCIAKVYFEEDPFYPFSTEQYHERQLIIAMAKDYLERKNNAGHKTFGEISPIGS